MSLSQNEQQEHANKPTLRGIRIRLAAGIISYSVISILLNIALVSKQYVY